MNIRGFFVNLICILPAVAVALPVHKSAYTSVSYKLGDISQKQRGRLTLNPPKHLDPFGTLSLIFFGFGWVKPVQVDPYFYRNKKDDMIWTAIAGPLINFIVGFLMVILYMLFIRLELLCKNEFTYYLFQVIGTATSINIGLGIFNLIPISPLDDSKILMGILKKKTYFKLTQYEMYLSFIMIFLLMSGVLDGPSIHTRKATLNMFVKVASMITDLGRMKLLFHRASPRHAAPLTALQHVCTDFLLTRGTRQWTYMSEDDVVKELPFTYVLLSDHAVVASFYVKLYEKDTAYATRIVVHPDHQGVGIGKAIHTWLKGYEQPVYLDRWNGNEKLKSFYKENGGHIIGVLPEADYEICVFCF